MSYKVFFLAACCVGLLSCGGAAKKQGSKVAVEQKVEQEKKLPVKQTSETKPPVKQISAEELQRLRVAELRKIIDTMGFVELPYRINFDPPINYSLPYIEENPLHGVISIRLHGVLPDTSIFYGFIEVRDGSVGYPAFITFDKSGAVIDENFPHMSNSYDMVKEYLHCDEYIEIKKDLSLHYYYDSKYTLENYKSNEISLDTFCEHYETRGKIDKNGKIFFEIENIPDTAMRIPCD